jgi:hypothetical protein
VVDTVLRHNSKLYCELHCYGMFEFLKDDHMRSYARYVRVDFRKDFMKVSVVVLILHQKGEEKDSGQVRLVTG